MAAKEAAAAAVAKSRDATKEGEEGAGCTSKSGVLYLKAVKLCPRLYYTSERSQFLVRCGREKSYQISRSACGVFSTGRERRNISIKP